jgi:catechol 2,3-dioxygenase-like lactoylglutathione lyase family enzyme
MRARFAYTGIRVRDLDATIRFYTTVLGMTARARESIGSTRGTVVDLVDAQGGPTLELNFYEEGSPFATPYEAGEGLDHLAFKVDDLDRATTEAQQAGHPVVQEIRSGTNRWVYLQDPNGIWIELSV